MRLGEFVVKHKLMLIIIFAAALVAAVTMYFFVNVNFDSSKYMPKDSELSRGIQIMHDEFDGNSLAQVMITASYDEITAYKRKISDIVGVKQVIWLDTMLEGITDKTLSLPSAAGSGVTVDDMNKSILYYMRLIVTRPDNYTQAMSLLMQAANELDLNISDIGAMKGELEGFYKDGAALIQVMFSDTDYSEQTYAAIEAIRALDDDTHMLGNPAMVYNSRKTLDKQTLISLGLAALILVVILFISSSSYFEPVLFIVAIGVAVLLNMGTDIILPEISYMTKSIAAVLQLALTMDYSIFLLHRFKAEREKGNAPEKAMALAIKHSLSPISASSMTTIISFVAIMFMSYTIGLDMGIVLAKGVIFSLLSVFLLLPGLILYSVKIIDKTEHKTFRLSFKRYSRFLVKTAKFLPILVLLIIIPCIYLQSANTFVYGNSATFGGKSSIIYEDRVAIEEIFGTQNQAALLIGREDADKEIALAEALAALDGIKSVQSLAQIKSAGMDTIMPEALLDQFRSKSGDYIRIALFLDVEEESEETTALILKMQETIVEIIGENEYYLVGESPSVLEIKKVVEKDYTLISFLSILFVAIIIALTFKSGILPVILVFTIESSIWISMSIPYVFGQPMVFIGYLVISAILLGTTIDYAILYANNYVKARMAMNKSDALSSALASSGKTIITSASIFTCIGFAVGAASTMPATNLFGSQIGFGGLTALLMVLVLLPQLLYIFDKPIQYLTHNARKSFYNALEPPPYEDKSLSHEEIVQDAASADNIATADIESVDKNEKPAKSKRGKRKPHK